jgi:glutathione synthase
MRHVFIIDPLPSLQVKADSTIAFMREAQRRGHEVHTVGADGLRVAPGGRPAGLVTPTRVRDEDRPDWFELDAPAQRTLDEFDVVWMRKDPPVDLEFVRIVQLLTLVAPPARVINDPFGLVGIDEKLFALRFPDLSPESLVSRSIPELLEFREKLGGEMILKPIGGCGGEGVFHLSPDDRNTRALLEMATQHGTRLQIAQRYVKEVREGDKRILLLEGEPLGAVLRVPLHYESRANFHVGGSPKAVRLTERDREICRRVGPVLREHRILFAGIDVIGDFLTEVNVTSPTGIREINRLDGVRLESAVLDAVERGLSTSRLPPPPAPR